MKGVKLSNITKKFGKAHGVQDLNIHIQPGEFFTFLGPSGCGKTTTLRMIAGFYFPTGGDIFFDDKNVTTLQHNKREIGMVFQNYALFPHLTVDENIAFGLEVRKLSKGEIRQKVDRARSLVRLDQYGSRKITELSGGQQQRVALARALVTEPDILLLDEPLSNLDAKLREETRVEIKRIQSELGVTTVYVTHDQTEAMAMSDRIMVMENGFVQQIGTPQEIYNRPANRFVATFIGETNLVKATVKGISGEEVTVETENGIELISLKQNVAENTQLVAGNTVYVSVRPELLQPGTGENGLKGTIKFVEFTGSNINYLVDVNGVTFKTTVTNNGTRIAEIGEELALYVPKQSIYLLGE